MDAELSWLGYLTSPEQGVGPGCWQSFQHGAMYWLPNLGAFALSTSINDKYNSLGGPLGSLGFPVHDEQPINTAPGTFFKFQNGKIFWRSTPESISVSMNSVYNFSIDQIQCMSTRSRVSDTLFVTASISIFGRDPVTVTKELGDHGVGFTYPNIVLENIPLAEEEIALFVYMIMNSGDSGVKSKVESMGRDLTTKGAQIAGEKAGQAIEAEIAGKAGLAGTIAAVGTWLGGLLDTPAPVVGNVIGGLLGSLTGGFALPGTPPGAPGTFIPVDFGLGHPSPHPLLLRDAQTPRSVVYGPLPADWQWSAANRVNFICHSQGGTTIRYLIELLSGAKGPNFPQFRGVDRRSWVKSVVTLGTPHKGTTVTDVVNDLLPPRGLNPLIDFITSCSYESRQDRIYDLHLDHWGFSRNPGETYSQMRARIAPDITTWWTGLHNGLYDNSISGIGNLNAFAPTPSPNIYYFTMSFCATRPFPKDTLTTQDINGFLALFPLNQVWNPLGVWGRVAAPFQPLGTRLGVLPSLYAALTWITDVANRHLQIMQYFSQIPRPGSQIPRQDMLPLIMYPAYAMGGRGTTLPGITLQEFQHNDGIVNTRSMDGPSTGPVNHGSFTARLAAAAPANLKGIYWNLGANATIDHADQIGVFTDPDTFREVQVMYMLFAELGDRLP
ncbi:hypothetical protein NOF04DRAFT_18016 [Fusarium oxysporum II5]|uniref:Lipase-like C-terminal domain-containing protein n=2 Tax=Fusarium oxysporum species complex TaxID=171631 RepID=X0IQW2_FUSO5|nr:uncharacterized protein FOIG_15529 [Fusarium odoratissimum NRRL 54006]EXL91242.1 hypothetical protein FOIG_15529 [Fusarium odoratissimum NRRL 54006]KAK2132124.1 hypothetical protein NOF04DRAFT_18016 [Fusarium oxysporum II5]